MGTAARKTDGRREERRGEGGGGGGGEGFAEEERGRGGVCVRGVIKEGEMRRLGEKEEGRVEKKQKERKETKNLLSFVARRSSPLVSLSATSSPLHLSLSNELLALSDSGREAPSLHQTGALTA